MQHVVLEEPGRFGFGESPDPAGGEDVAIVQVKRIGVCGTDIHAFHGRQPFFTYPRILGHELGVEIIEAPAGSGLKPGDTCAVEPYLNDPASQASRRGKTNCCEKLQCLGVHTDGGMRPYLALPTRKLHRSEALSLDQLALVETLCIGAHAAQRARLQPDDAVAVIGAGPIGLSILEFVKDAVKRPVTVVDVSAQRLAFVRTHLGIGNTIQVTPDTNLPEALREGGQGDLPTVIFDATGNAKSMHAAFDLAAHGGTIVFVGLFQGDVTFHDPLLHRKELALMSSRNATPDDFRRVIAAIESGRVDTRPWMTHRLKFQDVPARFGEVIREPDLVKAIVELS